MSDRFPEDTDLAACGVAQSIELLGGRYKLMILRALLQADRALRFGELRRQVPGASQKTVTRNLRDLEASGILTRTVFAEVPPRVEYALTEAGAALMPVFEALRDWRAAHRGVGDATVARR